MATQPNLRIQKELSRESEIFGGQWRGQEWGRRRKGFQVQRPRREGAEPAGGAAGKSVNWSGACLWYGEGIIRT